MVSKQLRRENKAGTTSIPPKYRTDVLYRREMVSALRLRQMSSREILDALCEMGLFNPQNGEPWSVASIEADLKVISEDYRRHARTNMEDHIATQLAKLIEVEKVAWSRSDLDSVLKAIEKECKLLGLNSPEATRIIIDDRAKEIAEASGLDPRDLVRVAEAIANGRTP